MCYNIGMKTQLERTDCLDNNNEEICSIGGLRQGYCNKHYKKRHLIQSTTRLYSIWQGIKSRCRNPNDSQYKYYGAIGRTVCDEWAEDFNAFKLWATENGYTDLLTIDRLDNEGNYEPKNCAWRTRKEQMRNSRVSKQFNLDGESKTLIEWSEDPRCEVTYNTLRDRSYKGWPLNKEFILKKR